MPVLKFFLIVVGVVLYVAYIICAVPLGAICAFAVYGLGMPIAYLVSLGQVLVTRPPSLAGPRWWPALAKDADPAVLQYFYGPARADAEHAVRVAYANCRGLWQFGGDAVRSSFDNDTAFLTWSLGAGAAAGDGGGHRGRCGRHGRLCLCPSPDCRRFGHLRPDNRGGPARRRLGRPADQEHPHGLPALP